MTMDTMFVFAALALVGLMLVQIGKKVDRLAEHQCRLTSLILDITDEGFKATSEWRLDSDDIQKIVQLILDELERRRKNEKQ